MLFRSMPPMALDHATNRGEVTDQLLTHYLQRQGMGLVIVEHSYVNPTGRAHPNQLGIYEDFLVPRLHVLVQLLHQLHIPVGIQITHAGARALESPVAPSRFLSPYLKRFGILETQEQEVPHELTHSEIQQIVTDFAQAAIRAKIAGFDIIEIHGAHGYLLNQFYSPLTNYRQDEYGGGVENRLRFPIQVVRAVREAIGDEIPLFYRLGADDRLQGGNSIEDSVKAAPLLVEAGVDCLDLSGGICGYLKSGPEGFFMYMAEAMKKAIDIPVMATGGICNPLTAQSFISKIKTDLIGIGRASLADPDWARKALTQNRGRENV